jgi:hypothetical protein
VSMYRSVFQFSRLWIPALNDVLRLRDLWRAYDGQYWETESCPAHSAVSAVDGGGTVCGLHVIYVVRHLVL